MRYYWYVSERDFSIVAFSFSYFNSSYFNIMSRQLMKTWFIKLPLARRLFSFCRLSNLKKRQKKGFDFFIYFLEIKWLNYYYFFMRGWIMFNMMTMWFPMHLLQVYIPWQDLQSIYLGAHHYILSLNPEKPGNITAIPPTSPLSSPSSPKKAMYKESQRAKENYNQQK